MSQPRPRRWRFDDAFDDASLAQAWTEIERRRHARPWVVRSALLAAAVVLLAAVVAVIWSRPSPAPVAALHRSDGTPLVAARGGEDIALDDGSEIAIERGGALEVLQNDATAFAIHLRKGAAKFSVKPGGPRRWRVEGAGVSVEVVGTVFEVARSDDAVRVSVERGTVVVRGEQVPDGVQRLTPGRSLSVDLRLSVVPEEMPVPEPAPASMAPTMAPTGSSATVAPGSVEARGGREATPGSPARQLLAEADDARRGGRTDDALRALQAIVERYPTAPEAPVAALTRARLLARQGRRDEARAAYRQAIELGLDPSLAATTREALDAL